MLFEKLWRAITAAPRAQLPALIQEVWIEVAAGRLSEGEGERLDVLARREPCAPIQIRTTSMGSAPRSPQSMGRRRMLAGDLPPAFRGELTQAQRAVLAVVGQEVKRGGECRLCVEAIAAKAGVCKSTAKAALRWAKAEGHILVERRKLGHRRNDSNVITILAKAWVAWLRLGCAQMAKAASAVLRSLTQGKFSTPTLIQENTRRGEGQLDPDASGWMRAGPSLEDAYLR
jgi:hypothetical protein